ncbi:MAG: tetratricopeptide repeat protein [Mesorhizobium sp.]|nr:MAG: tetratricopeptide repeat protein [Mesorhizobium sp.]
MITSSTLRRYRSVAVVVLAIAAISASLGTVVYAGNFFLYDENDLVNAEPERRALVIGNGQYDHLSDLPSPTVDAKDVGDVLASIGFEVTRGENLDKKGMVDKLAEFTAKLKPGDTAVFYYSGHGADLGGNFYLPKDASHPTKSSKQQLANQSLSEAKVIADLQEKAVGDGSEGAVILIIDACRNFPAVGKSSGSEGGLRAPDAAGIVALYAAGFGQIAFDRLDDTDADRNSVFTRALLPLLKAQGLTVDQIGTDVRTKVASLARAAGLRQIPGVYAQNETPIVLNPSGSSLPRQQTVRGGSQDSAESPDNGASETECDRLAADPDDTMKVASVAGVSAFRLDGLAALEACQTAVNDHPDEVRFQFQLGRALSGSKRYHEAIELYHKAAERGSAAALNEIGRSFQLGRHIPRDRVQAMEWFRKAADQGNAAAMHNIGLLLANDNDHQEAFSWYQKAADKGSSEAMYSFAALYEEGKVLPRNPGLASTWLERALNRGDQWTRGELRSAPGNWSEETRKSLQKRLKDAGVYHGSVDGLFQSETQTALDAVFGKT